MRFELVDGIRGHLLLGMLIAHLSFEPQLGFLVYLHHIQLVGMFDAEFFIPISGFLIGYLYIERLRTTARFERFVGKRLLVIYRYHLFATVPFLVAALPGLGAGEAIRLLLGVATVQAGGFYTDILPVYLYCFLLTDRKSVV